MPNEAKFGAGIKDDIKAKKQQYDRKLLTQAEARVAEHDKEKGLQNQKESTIRANLRTMLEPPPANETKATKQTRLDRNKALSKENDKLTKEIEASKKRQQLLQKQSKKDSKPLDAAHKKATKPLKKEDKKVEKKIGKVEKNATKRARGKKG